MAMQTDPVCGMQVDDQNAEAETEFQGKTYYFCSEECKVEFEQEPEQYAVNTKQAGKQARGGGSNR